MCHSENSAQPKNKYINIFKCRYHWVKSKVLFIPEKIKLVQDRVIYEVNLYSFKVTPIISLEVYSLQITFTQILFLLRLGSPWKVGSPFADERN